MNEYIFIVGENFDISIPKEEDKEGLRGVMKEKYRLFVDAETSVLPYRAHIGKTLDQAQLNQGIYNLPLTIRRLPVYYEHPAGDLCIGRVEAIEVD